MHRGETHREKRGPWEDKDRDWSSATSEEMPGPLGAGRGTEGCSPGAIGESMAL